MTPDGDQPGPGPAAAPGRRPPSRPSFVRRVALALGPLVVLLLLVEGGLWLLGLGAPRALDRGFAGGTRFFLPDPGLPGAFRTNLYEEPGRNVTIPPKGERTRVLLFGGSNTQLFPTEVLQGALAAGDPSRAWEVVNLGREGYGSRRVAPLVEQSVVLEPDVVVLYTGHNEFVELGFARELDEHWSSGWQRWLAESLSGLRLFQVLEQAFTPDAGPPPPLRPVDPAERAIPLDRTREVWATYLLQLTRMVTAAREAGAAVVLCTLVSNDLYPPMVSELPDELVGEERARFEELRKGRLRIPRPYRDRLQPPTRLRLLDWFNGVKLPTPRPPAPVLRPLLGPFVGAPAVAISDEPAPGAAAPADSSGAGTADLPGALWSDPAWWNDDVVAVMAMFANIVARDLSPEEREQTEDAIAQLEAALAIVPDHARTLFDLGLALWLTGRDDARAVALLKEAAAADRAPKAANDVVHLIVRKVAASHPAFVLLDAQELFRGRCPSRLVGYELLMDACHLHPGAREVLMADLAEVILALPTEPP